MAQSFFQFKQFRIEQQYAAMKVCTDACIFGAYISKHLTFQNTCRVLDIGTGTGLLSLMYAQNNLVAIDAIEIDTASATEAANNFSKSQWQHQFTTICDDIKNWQPTYKYNLIISNPPFYEADLKTTNRRRNDALHSTALSLNDLLTYISKSLAPAGFAAILLPSSRKQAFEMLLECHQLHTHGMLSVFQKSNGPLFRFIAIITTQPTNPFFESLIIKEADGSYTSDFVALLKPYYLKF